MINLINNRYVDTVSKDALFDDAVSGILQHLDPHTVYIPAREMQKVREKLEGNFQGIGIEFYVLRDTALVTKVIKNGPAEEAGLRVGDKLILADSLPIAGVGMEERQLIAHMQRPGKAGVKVAVLRPATTGLTFLTIRKGTVPLKSVDIAYMLDKQTGYIRINRFSATTYREFSEGMEKLLSEGMTALVLDLRMNPGGYLDAAVAIADEFIPGDKLLVSARGKAITDRSYHAEKKGLFEEQPLIILVDEQSASASEVVAGAVQDWDRGLIMGRRTYGKGLIQEEFNLEDGSALRLTVARYFTPSGRSIQRPYVQTGATYLENLPGFSEVLFEDSIYLMLDTVKYYTGQNHRRMYGGGGIFPDIYRKKEAADYQFPLSRLIGSRAFKDVVYTHFFDDYPNLKGFTTYTDFDTAFRVPNVLTDSLKKHLEPYFHVEVNHIWGNAEALSDLKFHIKLTYAFLLFREAGLYRAVNKKDQIVLDALQLINSPGYLKRIQGQAG